jgi:hypothetical protein
VTGALPRSGVEGLTRFDVRKGVWEIGWSPLPTHGKRTFLPGWAAQFTQYGAPQPTLAEIRSWKTDKTKKSLGSHGTGLALGATSIALDFDIDTPGPSSRRAPSPSQGWGRRASSGGAARAGWRSSTRFESRSRT